MNSGHGNVPQFVCYEHRFGKYQHLFMWERAKVSRVHVIQIYNKPWRSFPNRTNIVVFKELSSRRYAEKLVITGAYCYVCESLFYGIAQLEK